MIASLFCGLIFGAGLLISGMVQPTKVLGFLDIFGAWDPSLAVVMVAALAVSTPGFMLANGRSRPLLTARSFWPTKREIDSPLIVGAALFGIGWGLVGLCPGPVLESLATLSPGIIAFAAAMAGGMALHDVWQKPQPKLRNEAAVANADG
ncbi:MAG TPA: DUF6691 family protein [Bradyrhizobium sp.]|nr:DUF6691 family protein [Bradyrhizobium sp.]